MPITFDGPTKRIILDSTSVTAAEIWSRWCDWLDANTDNGRWLPALRQVGGDDLGGGLFIPAYFFLLNGWRVRPMEAHQLLVIDGLLFVEGGGQPVVQTLGSYNVSVQYTVPVQAQAIATSGSAGPTVGQIADEIMARLAATAIPVDVRKINAVTVSGSGVAGNEWGPA